MLLYDREKKIKFLPFFSLLFLKGRSFALLFSWHPLCWCIFKGRNMETKQKRWLEARYSTKENVWTQSEQFWEHYYVVKLPPTLSHSLLFSIFLFSTCVCVRGFCSCSHSKHVWLHEYVQEHVHMCADGSPKFTQVMFLNLWMASMFRCKREEKREEGREEREREGERGGRGERERERQR